MITSYKYEGKNIEEATLKATNELNENLDNLYIQQSEEEGKLFKSKKYIIEVVKKQDVFDYIKDYIRELSHRMEIDINCEVREVDGTISVLLVSSNNALLIGKDGKNLNALQILIRQAVNAQSGQSIKLLVDISGYKNKKMKNLEYEIKKICKEVLNTKIEVKLDPMNSFERRIVHNVVSEFSHLQSNSVGESPNRCTVISYHE